MSTVPEIIDRQILQADNYLTQAQAFINQVANMANTEFPVDVPASLGVGLTDVTKDALDKINTLRPVRPTFDDIEVLSPVAPVVSFDAIDQTILDQVKVKLAHDIEFGGYGIDTNDEAGLLQRERDREDMISMAAVDEIDRSFAEGGFSMPQGAMLNARAAAMQSRQNNLSTLNRDVALRRSELYNQTRKWAMEQAQSVEGVLIALHRVLTDQVMATTTLFNSQIQKYRADVDAEVETVRANLGIYTGDVQAFAASVNAISEAYRLQNVERQLNNSWNVEVVKSKLEEARVRLLGMQASGQIRNSAAQFGAQYYMGAITAALGSINTLAAQTTTS